VGPAGRPRAYPARSSSAASRSFLDSNVGLQSGRAVDTS
jgi:hypothetical protein